MKVYVINKELHSWLDGNENEIVGVYNNVYTAKEQLEKVFEKELNTVSGFSGGYELTRYEEHKINEDTKICSGFNFRQGNDVDVERWEIEVNIVEVTIKDSVVLSKEDVKEIIDILEERVSELESGTFEEDYINDDDISTLEDLDKFIDGFEKAIEIVLEVLKEFGIKKK